MEINKDVNHQIVVHELGAPQEAGKHSVSKSLGKDSDNRLSGSQDTLCSNNIHDSSSQVQNPSVKNISVQFKVSERHAVTSHEHAGDKGSLGSTAETQ